MQMLRTQKQFKVRDFISLTFPKGQSAIVQEIIGTFKNVMILGQREKYFQFIVSPVVKFSAFTSESLPH